MKDSNPSSKGIMSDTVDSLRAWAKSNCVRNASASSSNASKITKSITSSNSAGTRKGGRKIITAGGNKE